MAFTFSTIQRIPVLVRFAYVARLVACLGAGIGALSSGAAAQVVHPDRWPAVIPRPPAAATEAFVDQLLSHMTLEDKVGQMIQADIGSISPADLHDFRLGSILAGGGSAPGGDVRTTPQAWLELTGEFHRAALAGAGAAHPPIPLLFGVDAVHGHAKIIGATIFPHNVGLGAAHDPELIRRIGEATAEEVAVTGIDWTFAPTVAVARDPRWGRSYESYSESPDLVAQYAAAMVTGLQGQWGTAQFMASGHTLSSVKHFLGDGGTTFGRDQGDTAVPEAVLSRVHAAGYPAAIRAGAMIVMASYSSWNGAKMHGNHGLLTEVLKGRFGFEGFVVGDWNGHEQLPGCTKVRCAAAILAGVDMLMAPDSWRDLYRNTLEQVRSGEIPESRVNDAVRRILRVKLLAGAFERADIGGTGVTGRFELLGNTAHRSLAREAVRRSLVLLKNAGGTLPLNPHAHILVAGMAADDIGMQCGGWTVDWQGNHNTNRDFPGATSLYAGIRAAVSAAGGTATLSIDGHYHQRPDAAIVVYGETPYAEFQGDRETLVYAPSLPDPLRLLRRLRAEHIPVVSVFLSGRPLWVNPYLNASDAFVAAWLPGSEGEGVADLLFRGADGHADFTGRLSFSWPATGMPVAFDAADGVSGVLFARGYGLDYTQAAEVPPLPVDPHIPPRWRAPAGSLFHAGHATAPWSLFIADEAEVHVTLPAQRSPQGAVTVSQAAPGVSVTWTGARQGMITLSGPPSDLRRAARNGEALRLKYRVDLEPSQAVRIGMVCAKPGCGVPQGAFIDASREFHGASSGIHNGAGAEQSPWKSVSIPLQCLGAGAHELADVPVPFAIETAGVFGLTIAEVSLGTPSGAIPASCR